MKLFFGADGNGDAQKASLLSIMKNFGEPVDVSTLFPGMDNYVSVAQKVSELVQQNHSFGVLLCGTGAGVTIIANKHKGIAAVACYHPDQASNAKIINNANILCLSGGTPLEMNESILRAFFSTLYAGRKPERLAAIKSIEDSNLK